MDVRVNLADLHFGNKRLIASYWNDCFLRTQ